MSITKAIFPVAGLGTRFLPATKAQPKEMLPVVDKPLIQYAVEEAYNAGIREMIFVTGRHKRAIEDHFDTAFELEYELAQAGKNDLLELVHSIKPADMECVFVRQPKSLGLGHAVLCATASWPARCRVIASWTCRRSLKSRHLRWHLLAWGWRVATSSRQRCLSRSGNNLAAWATRSS